MTKFLLSALFITLSFLEPDAHASSQPFGCKFHNSRNCVKPEVFEKDLEMGCASPSGNCRYQFCKANCIEVNDDEYVLRLCKKNCLDPALLVRFDSASRETLYNNFIPSAGRSGKRARKYAAMAYEKEGAVQKAKSQQWWRFGRQPKNTALYEKLEDEYVRLISAKRKKMETARAKHDRRSEAKLQAEVAREIAEASENLVPPQQLPAKVAQAQEDTRDSRLTEFQRKRAAKIIQKWWRTKKGQKEAKRIEKERAKVAQSLAAAAGVSTEVVAEAKRMSGEWREGPEGRYFVPKAPPMPQSSKVKRLSMELRRQSAALGDLPPPAPPPPPAGWTPKGKSAVPPPPPMAQGSASSLSMSKGPALAGDLQDAIKAGKKLRPVSSSEKPKAEGRDALLADLQSENPLARLKKTSPDQGKRASSPKAGNNMTNALLGSPLLARYKATHGDEGDEGEEEDEADEFED
jgi:hypothetical protein